MDDKWERYEPLSNYDLKKHFIVQHFHKDEMLSWMEEKIVFWLSPLIPLCWELVRGLKVQRSTL